MKKVILFAAFAVLGFASFAQKEESSKLKFSAGVEAGLPIGDLSTGYSFIVGGSAQADYMVSDNFSVGLNAGYLNFSGKTISGFKIPSTGFIPVLIGGKYNFTENLYGQAQLGLSFSTEKNGGSSFTYAPAVGYKFSPNVDASLKLWGWSKNSVNNNALGLRVAYTF